MSATISQGINIPAATITSPTENAATIDNNSTLTHARINKKVYEHINTIEPELNQFDFENPTPCTDDNDCVKQYQQLYPKSFLTKVVPFCKNSFCKIRLL